MIRRGTFGLFAFISVQKPHLSARRAIKSEQLSLKGSGDAAALLAVLTHLSHKVNRSHYQLMNNTTPRLNFKECFPHCNLLMKTQRL